MVQGASLHASTTLTRFVPAAAALFVVTFVSSARAGDCQPVGLPSSCVDAENFWPHAGSATWATLGGTTLTAPGHVGFGLVTTLQRRPLVFHTPSADPKGTKVAAIDHQVNTNYLFSLGLSRRFELTAALPVTVYQTGVGADIVTSQQPAPLGRTAFRDMRLGVSALLRARPATESAPGLAAVAHLQVALPTGNRDVFAGGAGPVVAPTLTGDYRRGRFFGGLEVGARFRTAVSLGGTRIGSQGFLALGGGVDILPQERLSAQLEAFALPSLVPQYEEARDPPTGRLFLRSGGGASVPAEWLATVRSAPVRNGDFIIQAGFGTGLPLANNDATQPSYRFVLGLRYAPSGRDPVNNLRPLPPLL